MTKHFTTGKADLTGNSSAYYKLPEDAIDIQDLIEYRNMNFAQGNILKAIYRIGEKPGVDAVYDLEKIIWFANREINRLTKKDVAKTGKPTSAKDIIDKEINLIEGIMSKIDLSMPVGTEIVYTSGDKAGQPVDPTDVVETYDTIFPRNNDTHTSIMNSIRAKAQANLVKKVQVDPNRVDHLAKSYYNEEIDDDYIVFTTNNSPSTKGIDIFQEVGLDTETTPVITDEPVFNREVALQAAGLKSKKRKII